MTRKKKKPQPKSKSGNGRLPDSVLVPRVLIEEAISAITTKPEFLRPDGVMNLVAKLHKAITPHVHERAPKPEPKQPETADKSN